MDLDVSEVMVHFFDYQEKFNASFKINDAVESITSAHTLNETRKVIVYVSGYMANITWSSTEIILKSFRSVPNAYLISIDYAVYMYKGDKASNFENSVMHSYYIGKALGEMLTNLHAKGILSEKIHCVGMSLGAQIVGYAGETYTNNTSEKIWRITGLDPCGPCFSNSDIREHLRAGLAQYVEAYHCNVGELGTSRVLADIDFFFNVEGKVQPECQKVSDSGDFNVAYCSHRACLKHWATTVEHHKLFSALACNSYENYITGRCASNELTTAGYFNPGNATGVFYVTT